MPDSVPISVLVVDDHPVVRGGLCAFLSSGPNFLIAGEAATGAEAVDLYFKLRPSVVLMDLLLPDFSGVEAVRQICTRAPSAKIVVLTTVSADEQVYQALEAGARGYLLKDMVLTQVVQALRYVSSGRRYIPPQVAHLMAGNLPRPKLTSREVEVLQMAASGMRNKEIAYELGISEATVSTHIQHVLTRLNVSDRTQAVTVALRRGFIRL
jgi:DNA-binding NarL/FixJ family response regulator